MDMKERIASRLKKVFGDRLDAYSLLVLLLFLLSLYATRESFKEGLIASWDFPAHLVRSQVFDSNFNLDDLGLWGWYDGWYLGFAPFIFYTPGFFILVSLLKGLSLGMLSLESSMKVLMALSYALFPVAMYWMCRRLGFARSVSLFAAIFTLGLRGLEPGIETLYLDGLITQYFATVLLMLFLGLLHKTMEDEAGNDHILAGLLLGFIVISHMIVTIYAFFAMTIYVAVRLAWRRRIPVKRLLSILLIAALGSLFWLYPFFSSQSLYGRGTNFGNFTVAEMFTELVYARFLANPLTLFSVSFGVLAALYLVLLRARKSMMHFYVLLLTAFTLFISSDVIYVFLKAHPSDNPVYALLFRASRNLLETRALTFLGVLFPVIAGIGVDYAIGLVQRLFKSRWRNAFTAATVVLLLSVYAMEQSDMSSMIKTLDDDYAKADRPLNDALTWLFNHAEIGSVVKADVDLSSYEYPGTTSIDSLINLKTGLRSLDGNQVEACQAELPRYTVTLSAANRVQDTITRVLLHRYNVAYLLRGGVGELDKPFLDKMYSKDGFVIYKVGKLGTQEYDMNYYLTEHNRYKLRINVNRAGKIALPIQYNDHWVASVNGTAAPVFQSPDGLVAIDLPLGASEIDLSFRRKDPETAAVLVSFITVACSLALWIRGKRGR